MANNYKKMSAKQMEHWKEYQNAYFKKNFKSYNIKFSLKNDKDLIDYIEANKGNSTSDLFRRLIKDKLN